MSVAKMTAVAFATAGKFCPIGNRFFHVLSFFAIMDTSLNGLSQAYRKELLQDILNFENENYMNNKSVLKGEIELIQQDNRDFYVEDLARTSLLSKIKVELLKKHKIKVVSTDDFDTKMSEIYYRFRELQNELCFNPSNDLFVLFEQKINEIQGKGYFISELKIKESDTPLFPYRPEREKTLYIATQNKEIYLSLPSFTPLYPSRILYLKNQQAGWGSFLIKDEVNYQNILDYYDLKFHTEGNYLRLNVFDKVR